MKRLAIAITGAFLLLTALTPAAHAQFGLGDLEVSFTDRNGSPALQAGSHPYEMTTSMTVDSIEEGGGEYTDGALKDLEITLPPGFAGDPNATPRCSTVDFLDKDGAINGCADASAIGLVTLAVGRNGINGGLGDPAAVYNLEPGPGVAAKIGFWATNLPVTVDITVNPTPPYNVVGSLRYTSQALEIFASELTLWGNPADSSHDKMRGEKCAFEGGTCPAGIAERPFITLPRSCQGPLETVFRASSWWDGNPLEPNVPGSDFLGSAITEPGMANCSKLGFAPTITARPTTDQAESPSGLDVTLEVRDEGLTNPKEGATAHSDIKKAVLTLPRGVTANPSLAEGLATCSEADLARETVKSAPGEGCPEAATIGDLEVQTPLLEGEILKGQVFVATQYENPFNSLLALYMVIKHPQRGVIVKLAGKVEPNPETGQLISTFGEPGHEVPQFPVSEFRFHFREGGRSPLITPPTCGTYTTKAEFTPWANPGRVLETTSSFEITRGVGGAPCPSGPAPFEPGFEAGSLNNQGGAFSPFHMRLTRRDGDQDLARFDATLPRGMIAKLAGVTQCGEAQIASARARTSGREELASPSCPASSKLGTVRGGAGVGSQLTYVPGSFYLAGPINGAPLSVVAIVPAVAGPFDVGNVVVRQALRIDPKTAEVKVDSAASDALPTMLAGIPLKVRDVRVEVDRPDFTLNPTSCDPSTMSAGLWALGAGAPVIREQRFQAAGCASLGFKPKIALNLKGATRRGGFPALTTVLTPRAGDANLEGLVLRLPRSAFLEQGHFRTICTRVQFAAGAGNGAQCPPGSIYGKVTAWTPVLDEPAQGNVYLRSSSHDLPDIVLALKGPPSAAAEVEVTARVDSQKGGIRVTVGDVPDLPVSKAIVTMQGGRKGLIVNSRDLCAKPSKASAEFSAQNGKALSSKPLVKATSCKGKKRASKQKSRG